MCDGDEGWRTKDAFDQPLGDADIPFIDPFRCANVDPLAWKALQTLIRSASDPERALMENGISYTASALCYLTTEQLEIVENEMEQMSASLDFEFCSWMLSDYLNRAQRGNGFRS